MPDFKLGMNAKIFYGAADAALTAMVELTNVKDVTLNLETGEADVTTRANAGWRATAATLRECSAEFQMVWKDTDAGFTAIKAAWLASTAIELAILTGAKSTSGSEGPKGNFTITNFSRSEPLEEAIVVDVTAKLSSFDEWVEDGAETP